jgi:hypothetical protein
MLEDIGGLMDRVKLYLQDDLSPEMKKMLAELLGHVLVVIGCATKALKRSHFRKLANSLPK